MRKFIPIVPELDSDEVCFFRSQYSDGLTQSLFWLFSAGRQIDSARMWTLRQYLVRLLSNRICVS